MGGPSLQHPCACRQLLPCMCCPCHFCLSLHEGGCCEAERRLLMPRLCAGLLALRTVAISGTFALATSLAAKSDLAHAAAHQICLQLWLASSLLADSLAVAAQTLMAQGVAANELRQTRKARPSSLHSTFWQEMHG